MKAQSAIEYLITYGWMLLSVAVAGGAIYGIASGQQCTENISGFVSQDLAVTDFGVNTDSELGVVFENRESTNIEIKEVEITEGNESRTLSYQNNFVSAGSSESVSLLGVQNSDSCNEIELEVVYDMGPLDNQQVTGTLTSNLEIVEGDPPEAVGNVTVESSS